MTHGEKWLAKAHTRLAGWCKTRGWKCGAPHKLGEGTRWCQYEVFISDRLGKTVSIAFEMHGDSPCLVDDYGHEQDFSAVTFDALIASFELAARLRVSSKQLSLAL